MLKSPKVEQPQHTYFFERHDGTIFHTNLREAWSVYSNRNQILGQRTYPAKFLGRSDGHIFRDAVLESQKIISTTGNIAAAQEILREAEKKELEIAKQNVVPPMNCDTIDRGGQPINLHNFLR